MRANVDSDEIRPMLGPSGGLNGAHSAVMSMVNVTNLESGALS